MILSAPKPNATHHTNLNESTHASFAAIPASAIMAGVIPGTFAYAAAVLSFAAAMRAGMAGKLDTSWITLELMVDAYLLFRIAV